MKISQSYATGTVAADAEEAAAGGLVGSSFGCQTCEIVNSYATGAVGGQYAGGLIGRNGYNGDWPYYSISTSYATGEVNGATGSTGGLIGYETAIGASFVKRSYWDMTTSGITDPGQGAGNVANEPGIKGLSDSKLKSGLPKGFNPKIWNEDSNINGGLPYLIANPPAG
jgi:hypothetical protein